MKLPDAPALSDEGRAHILEFETGGREGYNPRPEWPGFASGVTIGIGYDLGYNSAAVIRLDWRTLAERDRLAAVAGFTGQAAKGRLAEVHGIMVKWELASGVFEEVTVTRFWQLCQRTFPGFDDLHANAQAAMLSLVFNRGNSLSGPRRVEMRAIREFIPRRDYGVIASQLRAMKKIWRGTDIQRGMERRREAEARLCEHG